MVLVFLISHSFSNKIFPRESVGEKVPSSTNSVLDSYCPNIYCGQRFAIATMIPIVLAFIFTAKRWYSIEFGNDNKIYTGPWYTISFLLLQVYPPFLACKLIYLLFKKDRRYLEAKRLYDGNVSTIGK